MNEKLNPFLSVWLHPKKTARFVIENKGFPYALLTVAVSYIGVFCASLIDTELYPLLPLWGVLLILLILSPIFGIISNAIYALIVWPMGKLFNGVGTYQDMFKALSLIAIPYIILIPFYIIWMFTDPLSLFYTDMEGSLVLPIITLLFTVVVTIWCMVISIGVVAEAHKIPNWQAFLTIVIPTIIFTFLIIIAIIVLALIIVAIGAIFGY
ncbi:YIP1 family protein [Lysinibacillus telephonicus]|uniref:YIP1 family protein n=1 Tax=Lysinibacillus telephonicus TaxID=1714840 RepID=UPI0031FBDFBD